MVKERKEINRETIKLWGPLNEVEQSIEEMAELILAIHKAYKRRHDSPEHTARLLDHVAEECADVKICMNSIALIVGEDKVERWRQAKLGRLRGPA